MANSIVVRQVFKYDVDAVSNETALHCVDESLATQADKEETDINVLVRRFGIGAELPHSVRVPLQEEFSQVVEFSDAMLLIRQAEEAFMEMPAEVRSRFNHDPEELVKFVSDPGNLVEARKLGLAVPEPVPEAEVAPMRVQVVESPPAG